jgi:glycine cleavage system H protein
LAPVKAVSEIYSPVTGVVTAVNGKLQNNPELLNSDPHGEAWLIQVELSDRTEVEKLMTAEEYEAYIQKEAAH